MKDIAKKNLMHKMNDIASKAYTSKAKNFEINISTNPKMNAFEALSRYKYMVKQH